GDPLPPGFRIDEQVLQVAHPRGLQAGPLPVERRESDRPPIVTRDEDRTLARVRAERQEHTAATFVLGLGLIELAIGPDERQHLLDLVLAGRADLDPLGEPARAFGNRFFSHRADTRVWVCPAGITSFRSSA